ncbi:hypothetical protein ACGFIR_22205 [Micromonospora sp. NPDC049051]|uniref:hypothetical protein n=1 Tax=Micromonospora sp. NPDC049051 TaxID=3364264 RepID=UPI00371492C5
MTEQLVAWGMPEAACVVDRDFDHEIKQRESDGFPVFAYENADLEAMASRTDAFELMLSELGSEQKVKDKGGPAAIAKIIYAAVIPVARLRCANAANGWGLAFDKVELADKVSLKTLELNIRGYCAALSAESIDPPPVSDLVAVADGSTPLAQEVSCPRRSYPYYRGRDFLSVTGVALRRQVGSCQKAATDAEHLAGIIRAIACKGVKTSPWGKDLQRFIGDLNTSPAGRVPRPRRQPDRED